MDANVDADANTGIDTEGSAIALPGLHPGELKNLLGQIKKSFDYQAFFFFF